MTTNYESIKNMNIEDLAQFLTHLKITPCKYCKIRKEVSITCLGKCKKGTLQWLQAESEE